MKTLELNKTQQHTVDRLNNTELQHINFDWMSITELFPDDVYTQLSRMNNTNLSKSVLDIFDNENFVKALYNKFTGPVRSDTISSIYTFWQLAGTGYSLNPHVDSYPRVFSMVLYFPENDDYPHVGTAIYEADPQTKVYQTLEISPYIRNSCLIIAPYENLTWHGVNMVKEDIQRRSVVCVFSDKEWNHNERYYADWKPGKNVNYGI